MAQDFLRRASVARLIPPMIVYLNGRYMPKEEARISPDDRGFLFGDGVYEVVRAHEGHLFRADAHWQRLRNSLAATEINGPTDAEAQSIAEALLDKNGLRSGEATVYLQITRGVAPRKHGYPQPPGTLSRTLSTQTAIRTTRRRLPAQASGACGSPRRASTPAGTSRGSSPTGSGWERSCGSPARRRNLRVQPTTGRCRRSSAVCRPAVACA